MNAYIATLKIAPSKIVDALAECEREAGARRGIYKRWIANGKIAISLANERQQRMDDAVTTLKQVVNSLAQPYQPSLDFSAQTPTQQEEA